MRVLLDGEAVPAPAAQTLGEVFGGVSPHLDPTRLVTQLTVDGVVLDPTDGSALAGWRLAGGEAIEIVTETVVDFARSRRESSAHELNRLADWLTLAAKGLREGQTREANTVLAAATRELGLILELDGYLTRLDAQGVSFPQVVATIERVGERLNTAERCQRWTEVASLLDDELVPALRSEAA